MTRTLGPQDECVQCGESREAIKQSQRDRYPIYCAIVSYEGECQDDWPRHRFIWTTRDEADEAAINKHYADMAEWMEINA